LLFYLIKNDYTIEGILVNSDVNGSLNILRKYVKDKCIPKLIQSVMDNGGLNTPLRIRVV